MPLTSGINWTDASFAPWRGCQAVSPACASCYSESIHKRAGWQRTWGPHGTRERTSADYWRQPLRWNATAEATGQPVRVFASHLSDIFDNRAPDAWRADFWDLVRATPHLTWLCLSKRWQLAPRMLPAWWGDNGPANVWAGATVENMAEARRRIPQLLAIPARVHWLSCEPLLDALDLRPWLPRLHWVICGGESAGKAARAMRPEWARSLRDQCADANVALWVKQTGSNRTLWPGVTHPKGEALGQLPADLRIRELPSA